jgi:hypothetical protein
MTPESPLEPPTPTFEQLFSHAEKMRRAEPANTDYWDRYIRGLYRGHYGHDVALDEEHEWQVEENEQYANGHGDGYHAGLMAEVDGGVS